MRDSLGAFAPPFPMTNPAPSAIEPATDVRRRWRWRRWFLGAVIGAAAYATCEYPTGTLHSVAPDEYLEVLGAQRLTKWESNHGRAQLLQVMLASHSHGLADTATILREARLIFPYAESLAGSTGDTIIEIGHRRYPLTRMLPVRFDIWTYYHRDSTGKWNASTSLWR